jgi:hypothetical protein
MQSPQQKGGQASMTTHKVSAAQIQVYLKGIDYPVNKEQLVSHAQASNAPESVMIFLRRLPERQYTRPTDVEQEFGKMK